ncbi:MAG: DNA translocase FtsK 4TM domain-containing protein [Terrisporobacter sp.]|uniref:FtsK/SpoIIIE family DNA translocase n=1 Tax=Terrisporobacter sp. TaxID=1965305 RepID=UPI002FCCB222
MAKKKSKGARGKSSKKNKDKIVISGEYNNLVTIFIGVFLLYSLNSSSMGLVGQFIQETFRGLFGALAIIVPVLVIMIGMLGFFERNEYVYRIKKSKTIYVFIAFLFVFYGLINPGRIPVENPLKASMYRDVMEIGVNGTGCGLITSTIAYFIKAAFGLTGGWLISLFILFITVMYSFNISLKDLILGIKEKSSKVKNGNINVKDKMSNLKESAINLMTEEVDEATQHGNKKGLLKNFLNKKDNIEETAVINNDLNSDDGDKTIKIVGFNKSEDDYVEILEGTGTMPELDVLKELQNTNPSRNTMNLDKTAPLNGKLEKISELQINSQSTYVNYTKPSLDLLTKIGSKGNENDKRKALENASLLIKTLSNFGVDTKMGQVTLGPTITRYEVQPNPGVKVSRIVNLSDDIALSLAAKSIRIEAPIPGKSAIGIEVPNEDPQVVSLREVLGSKEFNNNTSTLSIGLGKDISGNPVIADIGKMPHLLVAGATGSGKSVCINTIINSVLYKATPDEVKLLLIDPKVVELAHYNGIPHLLSPVVTDPKKAANALNWAVVEMNRRYKAFADLGVKDITSYNEKSETKLPKIVIIIDELADLMMACANEVEDYICRLAQMARAAGMHLIIATQRPSVDVITGVIKANIPSRIAFAVSSQTDSRTILDMGGAEKLLGKGDMLFYPLGAAKPVRLQGAYISENDSDKVINFVKEQVKEEIKYEEEIIQTISKTANIKNNEVDEFLEEAIAFVVQSGQGSSSMLQRKYKIGFNRAARLIDAMEERGIVGPSEGSKPRKVLITKEELAELEGE